MRRIEWLALAAVSAGLIAAGPAAAQVPEKFTNLTVLPKDIGKRELLNTMREFSLSLGVRCDHCHAAKADGTQGLDFSVDDLEPKKVARGMVKMVGDLNAKLPGVTGRPSPLKVRCLTCHHGLVRPESLEQVLIAVVEKQGVGAIPGRYKELREKYYGRGSYDFGPETLNAVAQRQAEERKDVDGAITVAKLNVEYNANSASAHLMLGQFYASKGDKDAAIASTQRALELEPNNPSAKQALQRLRPE